MLRPKRSSGRVRPDNEEFQDPLQNYETPEFADELERSLIHDTVASMRSTPVMTVRPDITIEQAVHQMVERRIACLPVTDENEKIVGIVSERDVLNKIANRWDDMKDHPIREVMTPEPVCVYITDSPAKAINLMAVGGFRHIPVLDVDDKVCGILGPRRVTSYLKAHA